MGFKHNNIRNMEVSLYIYIDICTSRSCNLLHI